MGLVGQPQRVGFISFSGTDMDERERVVFTLFQSCPPSNVSDKGGGGITRHSEGASDRRQRSIRDGPVGHFRRAVTPGMGRGATSPR